MLLGTSVSHNRNRRRAVYRYALIWVIIGSDLPTLTSIAPTRTSSQPLTARDRSVSATSARTARTEQCLKARTRVVQTRLGYSAPSRYEWNSPAGSFRRRRRLV